MVSLLKKILEEAIKECRYSNEVKGRIEGNKIILEWEDQATTIELNVCDENLRKYMDEIVNWLKEKIEVFVAERKVLKLLEQYKLYPNSVSAFSPLEIEARFENSDIYIYMYFVINQNNNEVRLYRVSITPRSKISKDITLKLVSNLLLCFSL